MNLRILRWRIHCGASEHPGELRFLHGISTHGSSHGERRWAHYFGRQLRWWCGISSNSDRPWFFGLALYDHQHNERVPIPKDGVARLERIYEEDPNDGCTANDG